MSRLKAWHWGLVVLFGVWIASWGVDLTMGDVLNQFDPNMAGSSVGPSMAHWMGTDEMGRDLLLRCLAGAKISIGVGLLSVVISVSIGTVVGLLSGFFRRFLDPILMRFTELMMGIPSLFLMLSLQAILGPSFWHVVWVMGITSWMGVARLVRAEVLSVKERPFVLAARARGLSEIRLLFIHIFPHTLTPILVCSILGMGNAIMSESVLSFLGLGVQPPQASWGNLLENSLSMMQSAPWLAIAPGLCITGTVLLIHWIGDQLREHVAP